MLGGFFEWLGIADKVTDVMRTIDKLEKIGKEKTAQELANIGIGDDTVKRIIDFIGISGSCDEMIASLHSIGCDNEKFNVGVDELEKVIGYIRDFGVPENYFTLDLTIARGLDYYTGTVYETKIDAAPEFGSVCSGGRYDDLTGYYTDQKLPGIGISIGLTRLFAQLKEYGMIKTEKKSTADVLVIPMDRSALSYSINVAKSLRAEGIPSDVYYLDKGFKPKMKYANRIGVPFIAIIGESEVNENKVTLKNMADGTQKTIPVNEAANVIKECK